MFLTQRVKVLAVQNIEFETLGTLDQLLRADGFEIEIVDAPLTGFQRFPTTMSGLLSLAAQRLSMTIMISCSANNNLSDRR